VTALKEFALVATGLAALIAVAIGIREGLSDASKQHSHNEIGYRAPTFSGDVPPSVQRRPATAEPHRLPESPAVASGPRPTAWADPRLLTPPHEIGRPPQTAAKIDAEPMDFHSVVGRPISMSPAIEASCQRADRGVNCGALLRLLSQMAREPRDPVWASRVESELRALINGLPGEFAIWTIECRRSLCAAEVSTNYDAIRYSSPHVFDRLVKIGIAPWIDRFTTEKDEDGNTISVTFQMFNRL
jgi:hypothetical protein